jgi:hypothetical protein
VKLIREFISNTLRLSGTFEFVKKRSPTLTVSFRIGAQDKRVREIGGLLVDRSVDRIDIPNSCSTWIVHPVDLLL